VDGGSCSSSWSCPKQQVAIVAPQPSKAHARIRFTAWSQNLAAGCSPRSHMSWTSCARACDSIECIVIADSRALAPRGYSHSDPQPKTFIFGRTSLQGLTRRNYLWALGPSAASSHLQPSVVDCCSCSSEILSWPRQLAAILLSSCPKPILVLGSLLSRS
jgi:hypothetical protein